MIRLKLRNLYAFLVLQKHRRQNLEAWVNKNAPTSKMMCAIFIRLLRRVRLVAWGERPNFRFGQRLVDLHEFDQRKLSASKIFEQDRLFNADLKNEK